MGEVFEIGSSRRRGKGGQRNLEKRIMNKTNWLRWEPNSWTLQLWTHTDSLTYGEGQTRELIPVSVNGSGSTFSRTHRSRGGQCGFGGRVGVANYPTY
jgi:hypothetical protein